MTVNIAEPLGVGQRQELLRVLVDFGDVALDLVQLAPQVLERGLDRNPQTPDIYCELIEVGVDVAGIADDGDPKIGADDGYLSAGCGSRGFFR